MLKTMFGSHDPRLKGSESVSDSESDDVFTECVTDYILGAPLYTKTVFENTILEKYLCDFRRLIPNIQNWAYNRKVDAKHVDGIYRNLKAMTAPHLMGSIKLVRDKATNSLTLLDGQHRVLALKKYMEDDLLHASIDVEVDVYNVEDITRDDIEIQEFFMKANNNKNVTINDIPETRVIEIIDKMIELWPRNIKTRDDRGAYRPNITKRELYNAMKDHFIATPSLTNQTTAQILKKIVNINLELRMKPLQDLFGREAPAKKKLTSYDRAVKHGFFLNLDCNYDLHTWLAMIK
jgi:hypothetical protein